MMHQFYKLLTPEEFFEIQQKNKDTRNSLSLEEIRANAAAPPATCECGNPVWRLAGLGMCFTCVTGETDASEDYELK